MRKIVEHTYGSNVFMRLELDGKIYEVSWYAGIDYAWNTYKTTADNDPAEREKVINAFNALY